MPPCTDSKAIRKYLDRYAEPVQPALRNLLRNQNRPADAALVLPSYKEGCGFIAQLASRFSQENALIVVVLNGPATMSVQERQHTLAARQWLLLHTRLLSEHAQEWQLFGIARLRILCLNLLERPQRDHGVGFARKTGMDVCLWLYQQGHLRPPWVHNSDADAQLPEGYFDLSDTLTPAATMNNASALLYPFCHTTPLDESPPSTLIAADTYDAWLRYYVEGLKWAESPWAFHTIGSTLCIHLEHYAQCRGFPKKAAGEDFYLLNKLAKTGSIVTLPGPVLQLSTRTSDRTPFGTGSAIEKIAHQQADWQFYHPKVFQLLKVWNRRKHGLYSTPVSHWQQAFSVIDTDTQPLVEALEHWGIEKTLQHCQQQSRNKAGFVRHLDTAMDASNTRKLVHWLRNQHFPSLSVAQLLSAIADDQVPFLSAETAIIDAHSLSKRLYQLQVRSA